MLIGARLRFFREQKNLSQRDIQRRTGVMGSYISRVESGFGVPTVETLEKFARALEVPLYLLFYEGDNPPKPREPRDPPVRRKLDPVAWRNARKDVRFLNQLGTYFSRIDERHRRLLLQLAQMLAARSSRRKKRR